MGVYKPELVRMVGDVVAQLDMNHVVVAHGSGGVVDKDFQVHGVRGLRIVDAFSRTIVGWRVVAPTQLRGTCIAIVWTL